MKNAIIASLLLAAVGIASAQAPASAAQTGDASPATANAAVEKHQAKHKAKKAKKAAAKASAASAM